MGQKGESKNVEEYFMKPKTISQLKLTGESVDGFVHDSGQHVEVSWTENIRVEDALHVSGGEGSPSEGHRRVGGGAKLEVEGVQEGIDDRSLGGQSARDDGHDEG